MLREDNQHKINLLSELDSEELAEVLRFAVVHTYDRRDVLYLPGDERSHLYLLLEGMVKLVRLSEDGREIIIATAEAGELFGELAIITTIEHETMAEMMTPGRVATIGVESFRELISSMPKLSFLMARIIGARRRMLESKIEDLAFRNVPARLAKFLLEQAASTGMTAGGTIRLPTRFSQQEIGSMIGSTRETTSHFLNDFRKSGLIDFDKRLIDILNPSRLAELSGAI